MFTGIIAAVGRIARVAPESTDPKAGVRLTIDAAALDLSGVAIGDSIAIAGACMTVVSIDDTLLGFDVSRESLDKTAGLEAVGDVNLEKALRFGDRLDGHLVSGHVDGTGTVVRFEPVGESWTLVVRAPRTLARFIALKGSIAVDGVSLTVNRVDARALSVAIIPHTRDHTSLGQLANGDQVNLEADILAKHVE
jgi:riboflavin synthase